MRYGLHLGCGPHHLDSDANISWENSDFADTESAASWTVEKKRDFTARMDDLADNSVDYIVAWHIVEHIELGINGGVIQEWARVLKPGGKLFIACPDLSKIARHIVDRDGPWQDWFICMVNVFGPYNGYVGDFHKWGFNEHELAKFLCENGFSSAHPMSQQTVYMNIGTHNGEKLGFADYNCQLEATK